MLKILILVGLVASTLAHSSSKASSTSAPAATHTISVGASGHNFIPSQVNASVGDIIEYRFYPQNHSVARAAYGQPCIPYEYTAAGRVGFWSGFFPVQLVLTDPLKFQVRVNDTEPIFFYCSAPGSCCDGMVGVINPNSTFTFDNQHLFSQNATQDFSPGDNPFPKEVAPTSATQPIPSSSPTTPAPVSSPHKSGLGTGAIVGIAIAAVFVALLAAVVIYMCGRQKTIGDVVRRSQAPQHTSYQPGSPGLSEAHYPNMQKTTFGSLMSGRSSDTPYIEKEGYRNGTSPIHYRGTVNQGSFGPGSKLSSPDYERYQNDGLRYPPSNSEANAGSGPHELPVEPATPVRSSRSAAERSIGSENPRPFSFSVSENGYGVDQKG